MECLCDEYVGLLKQDAKASDRFWALEKRIKEDRRHPGVVLELHKGDVAYDLLMLLRSGVITPDDLSDFSEDLRDTVKYLGGNAASGS